MFVLILRKNLSSLFTINEGRRKLKSYKRSQQHENLEVVEYGYESGCYSVIEIKKIKLKDSKVGKILKKGRNEN